MPTYKLIYFNVRARAEVSRLIFKQAGVEFEDFRFPHGKEWLKIKPNTPYGTIPVLEVDGKQLAGSGSIQRYLAEEFDLAGSNAWENAQLDSLYDLGNDFGKKFEEILFEKDEARKTEMIKKLEEEAIPKYLEIFEQILTNNASGWLFGSKLTYVDLGFFNLISWMKEGFSSALDKYPAIKKHCETVEALPNIAKWLKERPVSAM